MRPPVVAALTWLALSPSTLAAEPGDAGNGIDGPYLAPKLVLGVGGEVDAEIEPDIRSSASIDATAGMRPTFGLGVAYVHPVLEFLAVGAQVEVGSWVADAPAGVDPKRNLYADASLVVQPRVVRKTVEVHLGLLLGGSLGFTDDEGVARLLEPSSRIDLDTGIGYHLGALIGGRIALSARFGLLLEVGYVVHGLHHRPQLPVLAGSGTTSTLDLDADLSFQQTVFEAGVYF